MDSLALFNENFDFCEFDTYATVIVDGKGIHIQGGRKMESQSNVEKFLKEGSKAIQVMLEDDMSFLTRKYLDQVIFYFEKLMTMNPITLRLDGYFVKSHGYKETDYFWSEIFKALPPSVENLSIFGIDVLENKTLELIPDTVHSISCSSFSDFIQRRTGTVAVEILMDDTEFQCSKLFIVDSDGKLNIQCPNVLRLVCPSDVSANAPQLEHWAMFVGDKSKVHLPSTLISFSCETIPKELDGGENLLYFYTEVGSISKLKIQFPKLEWCANKRKSQGKICSLSNLS